MKKKVNVIAVLPVGPTDSVTDTIESVLLYMDSVHIVAIDDSKNPSTRRNLQNISEQITVLEAEGRSTFGALWKNLANAYKYALEHFDFQVLLKIDTDALVIAAGSDDEAIRAFKRNPQVGMLGSTKIDCNGKRLQWLVPANVIWREAGFRGYKDPERRKLLHGWIKLAKRNGGYRLGDYVQGGADFQSYACIKAMSDGGFLDATALGNSEIGEDFLFSIITPACGYRLGDFSTGNFPLAIRWRGLPDSPENLVQRNKKIVHSVRFWKDMDEKGVRKFFSEKRKKDLRSLRR